jgi:DNA repair exonuclease SbcCD nuclease subunit
MASSSYDGLLVIGDPHLESRQPGFRKDDYPNVILDKLAWCLDYAANNRLLPAILGDLFDKPRDNPNWMLARLLDLLRGEILCLYGNHDCADPELSEHDSLSLLIKAGRLKLISAERVWQGSIAGRTTVVGGSSYREKIPKYFERPAADGHEPLVVWLTHHDVLIPGYDEGRIKPFEIEGVDLLINGHIHRRLEEIRAGPTRWLTPGNISRRSRNDATRAHVPSVLRITPQASGYELTYVEVPHRPFDEVFHEVVIDAAVDTSQSAFVRGLAELQARRTASGAGLREFLEHNVNQFVPAVADEIMRLADEVMNDGSE